MIQLSIDFVHVLSLVWSLIIYRSLKLSTCYRHILSQTGFQVLIVTHASFEDATVWKFTETVSACAPGEAGHYMMYTDASDNVLMMGIIIT